MIGLLKGWFGGSSPSGKAGSAAPSKPKPKAKVRRISLERRFTLLLETAQGSMSKVYKASDNETGRTVCLKVQIKDKNEAAAARAAKAERPPEGEIAQGIVHPHVVRTSEHGETTRGEQYVVMEYVDGVSLDALRRSRVLDLPTRLELLAQAAEGLAAVHAAGFIHHDIGPRNYLVDREDRVKLIDFGLAVPNTAAFRKPGNRTGTLQYMAPELVRRESTDERLDIFSFGAMAFEFLTGKLPYDGGNSMTQMLQRINQPPLDPAKANPELPEPLCEVLRQTLARRKEDRWPTMSTLAETFRNLA